MSILLVVDLSDKRSVISCAAVLLVPADVDTHLQSMKSMVGPFKHLFVMLGKAPVFHVRFPCPPKAGRTLQ